MVAELIITGIIFGALSGKAPKPKPKRKHDESNRRHLAQLKKERNLLEAKMRQQHKTMKAYHEAMKSAVHS